MSATKLDVSERILATATVHVRPNLINRILQRFGASGLERAAPISMNSPVCALCMQYGRADLWNVYYAFRMNPQSRIWNKLRRQRVPWHGNKSIAELHETMLGSLVTTRTPDPLTLERILVTAYFSAPSGRSNVTSLEAARTRRRR